MSEQKHNFKIGDSVIVKPGVMDPDLGGDIGGWQGRITEVSEAEGTPTAVIALDSITLKAMSLTIIGHCEREGLDWTVMELDVTDIEPASPRDSKLGRERAIRELEKHTAWLSLDEEGERIQKVLDGIGRNDTMRQLKAWEKHLTQNLTFPFEAEVSEYQERGPLQSDDLVTVTALSDVDEHYGILVEILVDRQGGVFPLCDLEVTDTESANYQPVKDYAVWFANQ
jgi:hypothetical protein